MTMKAEQELRKELLIRVLDRYPNLDAAFQAVVHMERFVLEGAKTTASEHTGGAGSAPPEEIGPLNEAQNTNGNGADSKPRRPGRWCRWAPEDDAILRQCWAEDGAVEEIAWKLERSPASIYGRARQLGLRRDRTSLDRNARRIDIYARNGNGAGRNGQDGRTEQEASHHTAGAQVLNGSVSDDPVSIESVVQFLRTRDYSVVRTGDGRYRLDGRDTVTAEQLFDRANRVRERLGRPIWPGPLVGGANPALFANGPQ